MPDFERLTDQMRLDFAKSPEERREIEAWIRGKNRARIEVLCIVAFLGLLVVLFTAFDPRTTDSIGTEQAHEQHHSN